MKILKSFSNIFPILRNKPPRISVTFFWTTLYVLYWKKHCIPDVMWIMLIYKRSQFNIHVFHLWCSFRACISNVIWIIIICFLLKSTINYWCIQFMIDCCLSLLKIALYSKCNANNDHLLSTEDSNKCSMYFICDNMLPIENKIVFQIWCELWSFAIYWRKQ